jgi:hypothetical protein
VSGVRIGYNFRSMPRKLSAPRQGRAKLSDTGAACE